MSLRQVRTRHSVVLPRGEEVAEIRPLSRPATVEENLARLQVLGIIERAAAPEGRFEPVAHRPGGLARFLAERD